MQDPRIEPHCGAVCVCHKNHRDIQPLARVAHDSPFWAEKYTLNHKKRDILFLTITLASRNRFL